MLMGCPNATVEALIAATAANDDVNLKDPAFWTRFYSTILHLLQHIAASSALSPSAVDAPETSRTERETSRGERDAACDAACGSGGVTDGDAARGDAVRGSASASAAERQSVQLSLIHI